MRHLGETEDRLWTPNDLPLRDDIIYSEDDTKAMADYILRKDYKRILKRN